MYIEQSDRQYGDCFEDTAVLIDARTLKVQKYEFQWGENPKQQEAAFRAWLAQHPTTCQGGALSPDGKSTLKIALRGGDEARHRVVGKWNQQEYSFFVTGRKEGEDSQDMYVTPWVALSLSIAQDGQDTPRLRWAGRGEWYLDGAVYPCWSPDGRRLAAVFARTGSGMRDSGSIAAYIMPTRGPRIQVMFPSARDAALSIAHTADQLEPSGFVLSSVESARGSKLSRHQIQAAAGFEEAARLIAARLPEGATIEPLKKSDRFDLVVQLARALPPFPPLRP